MAASKDAAGGGGGGGGTAEKAALLSAKEAKLEPASESIFDSSPYMQGVRIALVVAFYFFISIVLVFLNKHLFTGVDFDYPLFITWFQQIVSVVCFFAASMIGEHWAPLSFLPPIEFDWAVAKQVTPATLVFVGMVSLNNLCLQYVEVSFYQVARALSTIFSAMFTYMILGQTTSKNAMAASSIVVAGFALGSIFEARFTWLGMFFGVSSSVFVALNAIMVKKTIAIVDNNMWKLQMYNMVLSVFYLLPVVVVSGEFSKAMAAPVLSDPHFWSMMTVAGMFGFLIAIANYMQIHFTSPLTHNLSGTAKAAVQTVLAVIIWKNPIPFLNGVGIFLVIAGSFVYSRVRYAEMNAAKAALAAPSSKV